VYLRVQDEAERLVRDVTGRKREMEKDRERDTKVFVRPSTNPQY
jgi:hypothetical protein